MSDLPDMDPCFWEMDLSSPSSSSSPLAVVTQTQIPRIYARAPVCVQCGMGVKVENPSVAGVRLCCICSIFATCYQNSGNNAAAAATAATATAVSDTTYLTLAAILDTTFQERNLKMSYDTYCHSVENVHTKVYTCEECLGPKQYLNPFKFCIKCIVKRWPTSLDKEAALFGLHGDSLMSMQEIAPYLRRRRELKKQRRSTLNTLYDEMGSDWRAGNFRMAGGGTIHCRVRGEQVSIPLPPSATCPRDDSDLRAVHMVETKRVEQVVHHTGIIADVAKIIVGMESFEPACNADGSLGK